MADAFSLLVPLAPPFRTLVPDIASRYAELSGGSPDAAAGLAAAVVAAVDRVANGAGPNAEVGLEFRPEAGGIRVDLTCGERRESVDVALPDAKPANPA